MGILFIVHCLILAKFMQFVLFVLCVSGEYEEDQMELHREFQSFSKHAIFITHQCAWMGGWL